MVDFNKKKMSSSSDSMEVQLVPTNVFSCPNTTTTVEAVTNSVVSFVNQVMEVLRFTPKTFFENKNAGEHEPLVFLRKAIRVLSQHTNPETKSYQLHFIDNHRANSLNRTYLTSLKTWVRTACELSPEDLEVTVGNNHDRLPYIALPSCVFRCESLVSLKLGGDFFRYQMTDGENISLPNLKKLVMHLSSLNFWFVRQLVESCPVLEYLDLYARSLDVDTAVGIDVVLSSDSLKCLTLQLATRLPMAQSRITVNAPKLEDITIRGLSSNLYYLMVNTNSSLVAKLDLWVDPNKKFLDFVRFLQGLRSVSSLELRTSVFSWGGNVHLIPIFHKLTHLTLIADDSDGLKKIVVLLKSSPKLETLVVSMRDKCDMYWDVVRFMPENFVMKGLKRVNVEIFYGTAAELNFLKDILSFATSLEQLVVTVGVVREDFEDLNCSELEFSKQLFSFDKSSSTCEIQFFGKNVQTMSSADAKSKGRCSYN